MFDAKFSLKNIVLYNGKALLDPHHPEPPRDIPFMVYNIYPYRKVDGEYCYEIGQWNKDTKKPLGGSIFVVQESALDLWKK